MRPSSLVRVVCWLALGVVGGAGDSGPYASHSAAVARAQSHAMQAAPPTMRPRPSPSSRPYSLMADAVDSRESSSETLHLSF